MKEQFITQGNINRQAYETILNFLATKEMVVKTVNFLLFINRLLNILKRKRRAAVSPQNSTTIFFSKLFTVECS